MNRQDLKDESKETEGSPEVKAKIRRLQYETVKKAAKQAESISKVNEATAIIVNPTHFAVALKYDSDEMEAPKVVAKGQDLIAQRILEIAEENSIIIVENPPLARALFATVDLDNEVPPEHYQAVAEVISYVWGLRRGKTETEG